MNLNQLEEKLESQPYHTAFEYDNFGYPEALLLIDENQKVVVTIGMKKIGQMESRGMLSQPILKALIAFSTTEIENRLQTQTVQIGLNHSDYDELRTMTFQFVDDPNAPEGKQILKPEIQASIEQMHGLNHILRHMKMRN